MAVRAILCLTSLAIAAVLVAELVAESRYQDARTEVLSLRGRVPPERRAGLDADLRSARGVRPGTEATIVLAGIVAGGGDLEGARGLARGAIDREPDNPSAWILLARLLPAGSPGQRKADARARALNPLQAR